MSSDNQLRAKGSPAVYSVASDEDISLEDVLQQHEKGEEISQSLFDATAPNVTTENAKVNGGKSNYQRRAKPPFSYIALIAMAIQDSQSQRLTLAEINDYLMKKFPFFRGDYTGWRNSVRHNLSLNECFQKVLRDPNRPWGKDNYWMLNESSDYTFADGVFRRRRKRLHKKSKCKTGDRDKASSAPTGKAYTATTGMNNFNPEHKHGCLRARQTSFLIDDLLARERSTSEAENATAQEVSSSHRSAPVHSDHLNGSLVDHRSQCEEDDCSSSPPARRSKLSKEASSSSADDHVAIRSQQGQRHTHSSSPVIRRSSSSVCSSQAAVSSSAVTLKSKWRDNVNTISPNRQNDGSEKSLQKYGVEKIIVKPQLVRFESAGLPAYGSLFSWPVGPYLSPLHHQAVMAAQQFTRAYPFSANTFSANLYPFLSPQQALQMSSSGIHSNDLSQQFSLAAFPHFPLKPFS